MNDDHLTRVRIEYTKTEAMRFTGHLDLYKTWERTLRRAGLPLAYSQGFNPRPKLNLSSALPLGFTSQAETIDIWFEAAVALTQVESDLRRAAPPGIQIRRVTEVELHAPALQTQVTAAEFEATLLDPAPELEERVHQILDADTLPRIRRQKEYDLRPLIEQLHTLPKDEEGNLRVFMRLTAQEGATGRPDEVLDALGIPPEAARIHRTKILYTEGESV